MRIQWSTEEAGKIMYAAGHLAAAEAYPEDRHAADSLELGSDVLDEVVRARLEEAWEQGYGQAMADHCDADDCDARSDNPYAKVTS